MSKEVIILRSVSGAGKSTIAEIIANRGGSNGGGWEICCADDYFMVDGEYKWDGDKLRQAHEYCFNKFEQALYNFRVDGIIVANTNPNERQWKPYEELAKAAGARVHFLVIENRHGGENVHNVPKETLESQEARIKQSLKLR